MKIRPSIFLFSLFLATFAWAEEPPSPALTEIQADAERGEAEGRFQLARAYLHGNGVPANPAKSFELMRAAAEQGHADALGGMGYFYSNGVAVDKDEKQAVKWFRQGAEKGSAKAQLNLAIMLLPRNNGDSPAGDTGQIPEAIRQEGLQWMKKAADQGLPEAALAYGTILYFGDHGLAKDPGKAANHFELAANRGLADAQNFMGTMNETGDGLPANMPAALHWFRQAAVQGHAKAQSNLGRCISPFSSNLQARIDALAWLLLADEQNEITARKVLEDSVPGLKEGELDVAKNRVTEFRKLIVSKK